MSLSLNWRFLCALQRVHLGIKQSVYFGLYILLKIASNLETTLFSFGFVRILVSIFRFAMKFLWYNDGSVCLDDFLFRTLTISRAATIISVLVALVYFFYWFVIFVTFVNFDLHDEYVLFTSDGSLSLLFIFVLIVSISIVTYLVSTFRIRSVAKDLFKEADHTVIRLPFLFVFPLVRLFINCLMFVYCLIVTMLIMFVQSTVPETFDLIRYDMRQTKLVILMLLVHFVGCFCVVGVF